MFVEIAKIYKQRIGTVIMYVFYEGLAGDWHSPYEEIRNYSQ